MSLEFHFGVRYGVAWVQELLISKLILRLNLFEFPEADNSRFGIFESYRRQIRSREKKNERSTTNEVDNSAKAAASSSANVSVNVHKAFQ